MPTPRLLALFSGLLLAIAPSTATAQCELDKVYASDGGDTDQFGSVMAVASGTVLVGAHFNDEHGSNAGAAYVYRIQPDGSWLETQKLTASDAATDDRYGFSVDLWANRTAIVGARYNDDLGYGSGSIYIYDLVGSTWVEEAKLVADDEQVGSLFGAAVAVHAATAVAGASDDNQGGISSGSAYVFSDGPGGWAQSAKLNSSDAAVNDRFGASVDVWGNTVVVGAYSADDPVVGDGTGAAYVFERQGNQWSEVAKLTASTPSPAALFGQQVRVDGTTIVAGAVFANGVGFNTGAAYVFERQLDGSWIETGKLMADDGQDGDMFGASVAVSGDTILVGAWATDAGAGSVYTFKNLPGDGWTQIAETQASDAQGFEHYGFGLSYDGVHAAVGARQGDDLSGTMNTGSMYVHENIGTAFPYGKSCPGEGGFSPQLSASGCPSPGGAFSLDVSGGLGGSTAIFFFGLNQAAAPFGPPGCTFNVTPILGTQFYLGLGGVGAGNGSGSLNLVIPADAPIVDLTTQAWILDPSVPFIGASGTNGLQISIE